MKVTAKLVEWSGGTDTPEVELVFLVPKEQLAGLKITRPEVLLDIIPAEETGWKTKN